MAKNTWYLAVATCFLSAPAIAQDTDDTSGSTSAETVSLLTYLGLSAADGATSVDGAGKLEGHMIATGLAMKAAEIIRADPGIKEQVGDGALVLAGASGDLDFQSYFQTRDALRHIGKLTKRYLIDAAQAGCGEVSHQDFAGMLKDIDPMLGVGINQVTGAPEAVAPVTTPQKRKKFSFTAADALGLVRTSNTLSGIDTTLDDQILRTALVSENIGNSRWIMPENLLIPTKGQWMEEYLQMTRIRLSPFANGRCDAVKKIGDDEKKAIVTGAKALLTQMDKISAPADGKPSLLARARIAAAMLEGEAEPDNGDTSSIESDDPAIIAPRNLFESMLDEMNDPLNNAPPVNADQVRILRVKVNKSGGTLVNSQNIATTLGLPGITIRGGLVAQFQLVAPATGGILSSGTVICRFPKHKLMSITHKSMTDLLNKKRAGQSVEYCEILNR